MNRESWLNWRRSGIGSSDASVIMGVNPWRTKMDLYMDKIGDKTEVQDNAAMARGREMEPVIRSMMEKKLGMLLIPKNIIHREHDFVRASLDAVSLDSKVICEIKTSSNVDHQQAVRGKVPKKYYPQLQHQLMCSGTDLIYYVSYNCKTEDLATVLVVRDDQYIDDLFKKEQEFWENHVLPRIPPESVDSNTKDKSSDFVWNLTADAYIQAKEKLEICEAELESARFHLIQLSQNEACSGGGIKLTPQTAEGRIDYRAAYEKILQEYKIQVEDDYLNNFKSKPVQKFRIDLT